ncbi:MAG TPA: hypothetical protein DD384_05455 [Firmicutes bacterium]|nr:hypothetical protein [Bacillota bacterium]
MTIKRNLNSRSFAKKQKNDANNKQECCFVLEKNTENYFEYVKSLPIDVLKNEYLLAENIVAYVNSFCRNVERYIEKALTNSIRRNISKKENSLGAVSYQLRKTAKLKNKIRNFVNIGFSRIKGNEHPLNRENLSVKAMCSILRRAHLYFHFNEESGYFRLNLIHKNLGIILDIFDYKLKDEGRAPYQNERYKTIRELGYQESLPDYLVGTRNGAGWDYLSILRRLLYSLKIYDCYPLLNNDLIPLVFKTREQVEELSKRLVSLNYLDENGLSNCTRKSYLPAFLVVEPNKKILRFGGGITILACMCNSRERKPLNIDDFLDGFDKLITNYDFVFLNLLLLQVTKDKNRESPQILNLKQARKIKDNPRLAKIIKMIDETCV